MYDVVIIGAGVVGASVSYYLSQFNLKVAVLEKENDVSQGTSKANSGIIHAGYDPLPNTLMAKLNVEGNILTKELCKKLNVKCDEIGSLVLAFNEDEEKEIEKLFDRGIQNGVPNMRILEKEEILKKEPNLNTEVTKALYAPSAAVVEPWDLTLAMLETSVNNDSKLFLNTEVLSINKDDNFTIKTNNGEFCARYIFNCAGVFTDKVHNMIANENHKITPYSGQYYLLDKNQGNLVNHVIFQAPSGATKGVLVAPTVHGNLIVGPNNLLQEDFSTKTTADGLKQVRELAQKTSPKIEFWQNVRNFSGLRAISDNEDFIIKESDTKGFFDVAGIKSPGLSAAVAIGKYCLELLSEKEELTKKENFIQGRKKIRFKHLSLEEKRALIKENKKYARVICRCETITEGEILDCFDSPIPPVSLEGVKRRAGAGMGRCQGGFCGPKVIEILADFYKTDITNITFDKKGSYILTGKIKDK